MSRSSDYNPTTFRQLPSPPPPSKIDCQSVVIQYINGSISSYKDVVFSVDATDTKDLLVFLGETGSIESFVIINFKNVLSIKVQERKKNDENG